MTKNPEVGAFLDDDEKDFIEYFEQSDQPLSIDIDESRRQQIIEMARATMNDEKEKISLHVSRADLVRLKSRAMQEGIPYQTLINSIIHKYVTS